MSGEPSDAPDYRRGLALIQHGVRGDDEGIAAIIEEAAQARRLDYLAVAAISLMWQIADQLYTPAEVATVENYLAKSAVAHEDPQMRLAFRLALAHRRADTAAMAAVLEEAAASGTLEDFVITCASTAVLLIPSIRSEEGMRALNNMAVRITLDE